jgi:molybdate transport system regulatory protein
MKLSARNQIEGTIQAIKTDQIMAEVTVGLSGGDTLVSVITSESARNLGLKQGMSVTVVIKSTEVMLATGD